MEINDRESLKTEINNLFQNGKCNNVGIFVDFDNIYYGMREFGINFDSERDYDVFSLMNDIYGKDHIRTMRAYADYDQVKVTLRLLQENRVQIRNVYGNGQKEHNRKNASDIELSIDAIESYYSNKDIDTYVFITADSDMIPVMSRMIYKGKNVHLFYIGDNLSTHQDMTDYCHLYSDLIKLFEIDTNRRNAEYYRDTAMNVIASWFERNKNRGTTLGGKWLSDELQDNLFVSIRLASDIIEYLKKENLILEKTKEDNGSKYYVIKKTEADDLSEVKEEDINIDSSKKSEHQEKRQVQGKKEYSVRNKMRSSNEK